MVSVNAPGAQAVAYAELCTLDRWLLQELASIEQQSEAHAHSDDPSEVALTRGMRRAYRNALAYLHVRMSRYEQREHPVRPHISS